MPYTERYVTVSGAGAHDGTSEANAWTFAEMVTAAPSGVTRVNIKSGTYSVGAYTIGAGTAAGWFVLRGYNSTIGDLDTPVYNSDGTINTTNFPAITLTGIWNSTAGSWIQNLAITGALSSQLVGNSTADGWGMSNCTVTNTQNNASARCVQGDNNLTLINCDFYCSGAAHASVVDTDVGAQILHCRFRTTSTSPCLSTEAGVFGGNVFWGNSSSTGIQLNSYGTGIVLRFEENTFVSIGSCIQLPNAVNAGIPTVLNNYATGCSNFLESLYSATANVPAIVGNNRTRNITTMYTGIEPIEFGGVTTAGSGATDYVDAAAGNFNLLSTAPGVSVAMRQYRSMGALQRDQTGSGTSPFSFIY